MQHQAIALTLLVSPKERLDFHKRSRFEFLQLVGTLTIRKKVDVPIEVYPSGGGKYYIADGVHRAKAAQLANMEFIDAIIYADSKPSGHTVPLMDVKV